MQLGLGFQEFPVEVRVYYYFQIGMYLSLLYSISSDTKRKDFAEVGFCMHFGENWMHLAHGSADGDPPRRDNPADVLLLVVCSRI